MPNLSAGVLPEPEGDSVHRSCRPVRMIPHLQAAHPTGEPPDIPYMVLAFSIHQLHLSERLKRGPDDLQSPESLPVPQGSIARADIH